MKILLTGKNGQVGWELQRTLCVLGDVVAVDSSQMNLVDPDVIVSMLRAIKPDLIVNPAAYTAVDKAESEPELAMAINGIAPGILAEEAKRLGARLIHYSTDYVFDGRRQGAYMEEDAPNPLGVYGETKLVGEQAIVASGCRHLILRTSWVYGLRGKNFLLTMRKLLQEHKELRVVGDQTGAPTWSRLLAETTLAMVASPVDGDGLYHLTCGGLTTWFDFASEIGSQLARAGKPIARLTKIRSAEYPTAAVRPENSALCGDKLYRDFAIALPDWKDALALCTLSDSI